MVRIFARPHAVKVDPCARPAHRANFLWCGGSVPKTFRFVRTRAAADESRATAPILLGSYRLLQAFLVFCAHAVWPLAQTVTRAEVGPIGVFCFFIVSGYLITM